MKKADEERFDSRVDRTGGPGSCHPWTATLDDDGYGRISIGNRDLRAHRVELERKLGRPISPGLEALHTCDAPSCCNPAHLYEGSQTQNMADREARGRTARGERHGSKTHPERWRRVSRSPGLCPPPARG
jgi:hypothetical protein